MTKYEQFEKLQIHSTINTISAEHYPAEYAMHWHQYVEIIALPADAQITEPALISINSTVYEMNPGDMVCAWSGELHGITRNTDRQLIAIQFPASTVTEIADFIPYLNLFRSTHHVKATELPELSQKMLADFQAIFEQKRTEKPFVGVERLIYLYRMFVTLGTYLKENRDQNTYSISGCSPQIIEKMNQACDYITEHCEQALTLDSISSQFGFSIFYFSRIFKAATSYNFTEYLTLQRVKLAQEYLTQSDMSITESAFLSGFKSISSFNRAFRQYKGCSPSEYRKYHLTE